MKFLNAKSLYITSRGLYLKRIPIIPRVLKFLNRVLFTCDIPFKADIDKSVKFPHNALGVVINDNVIIGKNTKVMQNVTLGGNMGKNKMIDGKITTAPIIGDNVLIGAGSQVLGPVKIGDNAKIGAGAIVLIDVPGGQVAAGVPAKILKSTRNGNTPSIDEENSQ